MAFNLSLPNLAQAQATGNCDIGSDAIFGPVVARTCRSGFDFTLTFEQSVLSMAPCILLLLMMPWRMFWLYRSSVKTISAQGKWAKKGITTAILVSLQLVLLVLWSTNKHIRNSVSLPAAVLLLVNFIAMGQLSYLEHTRSTHPSTMITLYLFFSTILDIPQARTLLLRHESPAISGLFITICAAKLTLFSLEAKNKTNELKDPYRSYPPEAVNGILNRTFFWWLSPLLWKGFKKVLTLDDLFPVDTKLSSDKLRKNMIKSWNTRPETRYTLPWATVKSLRWEFIAIIPPRLALIGFTFSQPFLISTTIKFVSKPIVEQSPNHGLGLIAAAGIIYTGVAVSTVHYKHHLYRSITLIRGSLIGIIYDHTIVSVDGFYDDSAAITLMSTDIDRIAGNMQNIHEIWARLLEVAIAIWLLERQLGVVCVIPIILVLVCGYLNTRVANLFSEKQKIWNQAIQARVAMTSSMLSFMKSVKMMGLSDYMFKTIQRQRVREIGLARGYRWILVLVNVFANAPQIFAPLLTFVVFGIEAHVKGSNSLSTNQAFTSLAIISLMTVPATQLLQSIPQTASCLGCFERIQKYILAPHWAEKRLLLKKSSPLNESQLQFAAGHDTELQTIRKDSTISRENILPTIRTESFLHTSSECPPTLSIHVKNLIVRPSPQSDLVINNLELDLDVSSINMLTGPVGCGKSTLIRAILGETNFEQGSVSVSTFEIGYCAQTPWLLNETIQKNICGLSEGFPLNKDWYDTVLHACCLKEDLLQFPQGDQTAIGNRGLMISGGQRQRMALARAIYARRDIILLDEVLSALDSKTGQLIAERLMGERGLLRKLRSTVLFATHTARYLHLADQIIVLGANGSVVQKGTFDSLKNEDGYMKSMLLSSSMAANEGVTMQKNTQKAVEKIQGPVQDQVADLTRKTGDFSVYLYYYKAAGVLNILALLAITAALVFATYFPQVWLRWWTESGGRHIIKYIVVYVILGLIATAFRAFTLGWAIIWIGPRSSIALHYNLLKTAVNASQSFHTKTDIGITLNRFSQDLGLVDENLPVCSMTVIGCLFHAVAQAALISTGSTYMACTIPFVVVVVYVLQKFYLLTSRQLRYLDLEARSSLYTHFLETLDGLASIRAMGWQDASLAINTTYLDLGQRPYYLLYCIQRWLNLVLDLLVAIVAVSVVAMAVKIHGSTSGAAIGIALINILGFTQSLSTLVDAFTQLETSLGAIARLKSFESDVASENLPRETEIPPANWPDKGRIEFSGVTAAYESSAPPVLRNISLIIEPGQKIGICGRTGSGKSSLLLALLRLVELQSGTIFIDGVDLSTIPRQKIRTSIITIPQEPFIFNGSVRANADPTGMISDAAIIEAMKKIKLWDRLESCGGLEAQMKTQPLSEGQQQLFVLARAILCKDQVKILILDEATSQVDLQTDQLMKEIIRDEFKQHVILTVSHRLNTILDSDSIAVLSHGELVEFGNPNELMMRPSWFRDMQ